MNETELISYIREHFPIESTNQVAKDLNLTEYKVRTLAKKNRIHKSKQYLDKLRKDLVRHRRKWHETNVRKFYPTFLQEQITFGSMRGDSYISKGAQRSINYYYQEHFGNKQIEYRQWKLTSLKSLGFSINGAYLRSISHPYFTNLYPQLYHNNQKVITSEFLSTCTHPVFLAALYLDDGTLALSYKYNESSHTVYCHPTITLYTLSFTRKENEILASHLNKTFGTAFIVSSHSDGKGALLKINKEKEVRRFISVIEPFVNGVKSMAYKINIQEKLDNLETNIKVRYGNDVKIILSSSGRMKNYTKKEISILIQLKNSGLTDQEIEDELGRSYWPIVYKLRELRRNDLL